MTDVAPAYRYNGQPITAEQFYAIACDPRRSVAVEACAGAGKTWMLVSRIVRALLDGMDAPDGDPRVMPHEILAITFTRRAASEMQDRLYQWLAEFARSPEQDLIAQLRMRGVRAADAAAGLRLHAQRLATLYQRVLESGRQVQIRTFHGWFAALLRAAPLSVLQQLDLPPGYELLEDDEQAIKLVWRRFYAVLAGQDGLKSDFEALVFDHGRSQTEKALSAALGKRIEFGLADAAGVVEHSVQHFSALFPELAALDEPSAALLQEAARLRWLGWAQALGQQANKTPRNAAQAVLGVFAPAAEPALTAADRSRAMLATLRRALFVAREDRLTQHLTSYPAAQQAAQELAVLCAASDQHAAWLYQQRMARLSRVLLAEYAALKRERGWIDMPDVERAALVLLSDPVLSGWVQERLDVRVRHLLIDEFQDTNPLQWQALLSWLGSYAGAGGKGPSVFIVGDPKQSIYRFRRAEPQVFRAAQQFIASGLGGDLLSCEHTRRNAAQVIATVNAAMAQAAAADQYEGFREHTTDSSQAGLVCRLPAIPRPSAAPENGPAASSDAEHGDGGSWRDSLTEARELPEETLRNLEARQVARWIAQRIGAGLVPSDVMVLSRRRVGLLPMQLELRALRIAAQIGEKTALIDCCEVQDLVALLDVLVSNQHDLSLARALKSPLFGLGDDDLIALALGRRATELPWFDLLQQDRAHNTRLQGAGVVLRRWKAWLDRLPPHDALQAIYGDGDVLARFAVAAPATQRDAVLANLRALLAASLQLGGGRYATPYGFVRALKAGTVQAPAVVADGAVRLLTIHGAKGLEAEVVVLLDTDTPERAGETMAVLADWPGEAAAPQRFFFLASERRAPVCARPTLELEHQQRRREELNALYVALTRARHTLVISSITPHRAAPASWWQRLVGLVGDAAALPETTDTRVAQPELNGAFSLKELPAALTELPKPDVIATGASGLAPSPVPGDEDTLPARLGRAMHRLLEWGDASIHNTASAAREFDLDPDQAEQAAAMALRILGGQGAWAWDPTQVDWQGNEVELFHQGELLRLDRLVQRRDTGQWWVLDYKSDHAPQLQPALLEQLHRYRCAMQEIHPDTTVRAAFLTAAGAMIELAPDGPV